MELRELTTREVEDIYRSSMVEAFPANERKPLYAIQSLRRRGAYRCWGLLAGEEIIAYAFLCCREGWGLLDYCAVRAPYRGQGHGSRLLEMLREAHPELGILAEVEDPDRAEDEAERITRERRVTFYLRLGYRVTGVSCRLFGVDYRILARDVTAPVDDQLLKSKLTALYVLMMGKRVTAGFLRFYDPIP